jgi:hypothetical protein
MSAYSLTAEGYAYFKDADSKAPIYLCGARITPNKRAGSKPTINAYYSADEDKRLTIWQWYTAVCEVLPKGDCSLSVPINILVGTEG